jgi:hypothetical protein
MVAGRGVPGDAIGYPGAVAKVSNGGFGAIVDLNVTVP